MTLSKMQKAKALITLCGYTGWSALCCSQTPKTGFLASQPISLSLFVLKTHKYILWQTVKTQVNVQECGILLGSSLFARMKSTFRDRNTSLLGNYKLCPRIANDGQSHSYCIKIYGGNSCVHKGLSIHGPIVKAFTVHVLKILSTIIF